MQGKKTGGRQLGTVNKLTRNCREAIEFASDALGGAERLAEWAAESPENQAYAFTETYVVRMRSLARSAIAIVAALITACGIPGMTEASTTRKSAMPLTRSFSSTTLPMRQVPTGW